MLVLSRKKDEKILLKIPGSDEDIEITVVRIDSLNKVRLGIKADKEIIVLRSELEDNGHAKNGAVNRSGICPSPLLRAHLVVLGFDNVLPLT